MLALIVSVDTDPAKREVFLTGIEDDATSSERDEPGCVRFNVFQSKADPSHFYFYEVYRGDEAFQAHQQTPHYERWWKTRTETVTQAQRTMTTPIIPRDEAYWEKRSAPTGGDGQIPSVAILVQIDVKPDQRDVFLAAIEDDALSSLRDEPGCVRFDVLQDRENANRYHLIEIYRDDAAFQAHNESPHIKRFYEQAGPALGGQPQVTQVTPLLPRSAAYWQK